MQTKLLDITNTIAQNYVNRVSYELNGITKNVQFLSTNKVLTDINFSNSDKLNLIENFVKSTPSKYYSMALYDKKGNVIVNTSNKEENVNVSNKSFFKSSLNGRSFLEKKPEFIDTVRFLHYSVPVYGYQNRIIGVLDARIPVTIFNDIIDNNDFYFRKNNSNSIFKFITHIMTTDGLEVYNNRYPYVKNNQNDISVYDHPSYSNIKNNMPLFYKNQFLLNITEPKTNPFNSSNMGWKFVFQGDLSFVANDYGRIVYEFILFSVLVLLLSIFIIYLFIKRTIFPLSKLKDIALNIGHGKFETKINLNGSDEIRDLAISLESMRRNILKFNNHLKDLVSERTKELEYTNSILKIKENQLMTINEELKNSNKTKEEFLSMMSHELKTPITPMKLYIEMLLHKNRNNNLNNFQKKALDVLYKNIVKLELVINDMFSVYKLELGNFRIRKETVDINKLIENNMIELKPLMKEKNIYFDYVINSRQNVICDPVRISQVLHNLISNAVDHVPEQGGRILIRVNDDISYSDDVTFDTKSGKLIVSVEDNGIGIPKEKAKDLFKKFYQIDTGLKRKHGGTGLGLAICKGIMEAHGESIWLDDTYSNGACFKFTLKKQ